MRIKVFGEDHESTADSYDSLGVTQQRSLDIRIKVLGKDNASTANSYDSLGVTQHSLSYFTSALQSNSGH